MNLFKEFVLSRAVKSPLDFGHNHNIVVEAVDINERKRNGIVIKANTFIKLSKVEPSTRKVLSSTEVSFFNLDPTKDFVYRTFFNQFNCLVGVIDAVGGSSQQFCNDVMVFFPSGDTEAAITAVLKKPTTAKQLQDAMTGSFYAQVQDKIGLKSNLLKCKMVVNKSGFLEAGIENNWILPEDSTEQLPAITSKDTANRAAAAEVSKSKAKPDTTGAAPEDVESSEKVVASPIGLDSI